MDDIQMGTFRLTADNLSKIMKCTGETEAEVRKAAADQGWEVEDLPKPPETGLYL